MSEKIKEMALDISYEMPFLQELDISGGVAIGDAYSAPTLSPGETYAVIPGEEPTDEGANVGDE